MSPRAYAYSAIAALALGALPLLIYPLILLAGVMSLAAEPQPNAPALLMFAARLFLYASLAYPLVYALFLGATVGASLLAGKHKLTFLLSLGPSGYLLLLGGLLVFWAATEATTAIS